MPVKATLNIIRKLAPVTVVALAIPLNVTPFLANADNAVVDSGYVSDLALDVANNIPVKNQRTVSVIQPGESVIQIEERQKAEAAAKAKAEAEAAARKAIVARENRTLAPATPVGTNIDLENLYVRAGSTFGVAPQILKSIHLVESGGDIYTAARSSKGATGPMQFLPSTFRRHAVDGNGDGAADIMNVEDAVYSAAAYLKACGYNGSPEGIKKAIFGYNHSISYYNRVMGIAHNLGF